MKFLDYIQGVRRGKEAHRIEHKAMDDPFLSAAIEGYDSIPGNYAKRIAEMQATILARSASHKTKPGAWRVAAAAVAAIALLSGYFALMNHRSSMALAHQTDNSYINLYAPQMYIDQKRLELTAMIEKDSTQDVSVETVVPIANLKEVIKPLEVLPLYVPHNYVDLNKDGSSKNTLATETNKIFITDASTSVLAEAKTPVPTPKSGKGDVPDKLRDAWTSREVTQTTHIREVEVNNNGANGQPGRIIERVVSQDPAKTIIKETKATNIPKVDSHEARLLAEQAGFDKIDVVSSDELDGNVLELSEKESSTRTVTRESFYRPKKSTKTSTSSLSSERTKPEPIIGWKEYKDYLKNKVVRPSDTECEKVKGKVSVQFSVDQEGNPTNIVVTKGLCKTLDREAVRLIKQGSRWKYGTLRIDVEVQF